ncbi:MAG TPA: T9SS type A sorting domain-containing protein [Chitinophagales bacterium]|nr:T9SS type A sorting domain-containing protein [Chitinophagales bacterium]
MKQHFILLTALLFACAGSKAQNLYSFGGTTTDAITSIAIDKQENVLCALSATSDTTHIGDTIYHKRGAYLVKIRPDSTIAWHVYLGNGLYNTSFSIPVVHVNAANEYFVTGLYTDTFSIGNITLTDTGDNAFIARLDTNGAPVYLKRLGNRVIMRDFCFDAQGNIIIAGLARGNAATLLGDSIHTYGNTMDILLAKLTPQADVLWHTTAGGGGTYSEYLTSVCVDAADNIYVGGSIRSNAAFDNLTIQVHTTATYTGIVAKYNSSGAAQWVNRSGQFVETVACTPGGEVLAGGDGRGIFGTDTLWDVDGFLSGFNTTGGLTFVHGILESDSLTPNGSVASIKRLSNGNFLVAGFAADTFYFGNMLYTEGVLSQTGFTGTFDITGQATQKSQIVLSNALLLHSIDISECTFAAGGMVGYQQPNPQQDTVVTWGSGDGFMLVNKISNDCETITGIPSPVQSGFLLYPNPADNAVNMHVSEIVNTVSCHDMAGRTCDVSYSLSNSLLSINTQQLSPGMYILKINGLTAKFVKQ